MHIYRNGLSAHELTETFHQIPLLQAFNDGHLNDILRTNCILIYESDELIIPEGAFGDRLYVLISGKVQLVKNHCPIVVLDQVGERLRKTTDELAQAVREIEATRRKLADMRRDSHRNEVMDEDLQWSIDPLRRTKEKLARIGRGSGAVSASAAPPESLQ